jgi:hypothetical protein
MWGEPGRLARCTGPRSSPAERPTVTAWRADLQLLEQAHRTFRGVVATLTPRDLRRTPPGAEFDTFGLVSGVAAHDFYHAGQIQLLKRLMPRTSVPND